MDAAKLTAPVPNYGITLGPEGALLTSQIKNRQYPTILITP